MGTANRIACRALSRRVNLVASGALPTLGPYASVSCGAKVKLGRDLFARLTTRGCDSPQKRAATTWTRAQVPSAGSSQRWHGRAECNSYVRLAMSSKDDECHESNELGSTHFSSYSQTSNNRFAGFACRTIRFHCPIRLIRGIRSFMTRSCVPRRARPRSSSRPSPRPSPRSSHRRGFTHHRVSGTMPSHDNFPASSAASHSAPNDNFETFVIF